MRVRLLYTAILLVVLNLLVGAGSAFAGDYIGWGP
jgi:hypothetical protein